MTIRGAWPLMRSALSASDVLRGYRARYRATRNRRVVGLELSARQRCRVVATIRHDPCAFTQGLCWDEGLIYESTGLPGRSTLRVIDPANGRILIRHRLPPDCFGEGVAVAGDRVIQLTWRSRKGFVYDKRTLTPIRAFSYQSEGWGLTCDGSHLIMSDGSATLKLLDLVDFSLAGAIPAHDRDAPPPILNDLQWVSGTIWANVWPENRLVQISAQTGEVIGSIDLSPLAALPENRGRGNVPNGIAVNPGQGHLVVTGKRWPRFFVLELGP